LWHTTHPDHFRSILASGAILLEPPGNPNPNRWQTLGGQPPSSYAKKLGGISLFDFDQFDAETYSEKYPLSSWQTFVPYREKWGGSVWIEIDREQIASGFISGLDLVVRRRTDQASLHIIMPYIEAAHLGPIPKTAFKKAFLVCEDSSQLQPLSVGASAQDNK
jgi:hypothetical protein